MKTAFFAGAVMLLGAAGARAQNIDQAVYAPDSVALTASYLLNNAPLPMLYLKGGTSKFSVMPAYYTAGFNGTESDGQLLNGSFTGFAAAASYTYAFADRWGIYAMGLGSTMSGSYSATGGGSPGSSGNNVQANFEGLYLGLVHQFFGKEPGSFTLPVFAGAAFSRLSSSEHFLEGPNNGTGTEDFDLSLNHVYASFFVGVEAGIPVGSKFQLNPFVIFSPPGGKECETYTTSNVQLDASGIVGTSDGSCGGYPNGPPNDDKHLLSLSNSATVGLGVNATYVPWGLTVNLTSTFANRLISQNLSGTGMTSNIPIKITMFTLSKSFGDYQR